MSPRLEKYRVVSLNSGLVAFGLVEFPLGCRSDVAAFGDWPLLLRIVELPALRVLLPTHPFLAWLPFSLAVGLIVAVFAKYFWLLFIVPPNDLRPLRLPAIQPSFPENAYPDSVAAPVVETPARVVKPPRVLGVLEHLDRLGRICPDFDTDTIQRDLAIWHLHRRN